MTICRYNLLLTFFPYGIKITGKVNLYFLCLFLINNWWISVLVKFNVMRSFCYVCNGYGNVKITFYENKKIHELMHSSLVRNILYHYNVWSVKIDLHSYLHPQNIKDNCILLKFAKILWNFSSNISNNSNIAFLLVSR